MIQALLLALMALILWASNPPEDSASELLIHIESKKELR